MSAKSLKNKVNISALGSIAGLVALIIITSIVTKGNFLEPVNISNVMRQVCVLGFASLGMCIVILTGNIDLSIIGNVSMTTVTTAVLMQKGLPIPVIILAVIAAGTAVGLVNGIILNIWKIESFVVTMGMQVVCFGLAQWISDSRTVIVPGDLMVNKYSFFMKLASSQVGIFPVMFLFMIGLFIIFALLMKYTRMGRYIQSLGGSEEVCYMSGVNVSVVRGAAYALSGLMAGVAGIFMYSRSLCGDPAAGNSLGMYVVAAVVVGGTKMSGGRGNILFTITGIFIIQIINNMLNLIGAPYQLQQIVQGLIILVAVIISSKKRR